MVLLTDYFEPVSADAVEAFVDVDAASPFFDSGLGGVPACVALEYMAQAMALLVGLLRRRRQQAPKIGFVLGSRRLEMRLPCFRAGGRYRVTATCTYEDESFGSFDCAIVDADGVEVAAGTLTAFQPQDEISAEQLKEFA